MVSVTEVLPYDEYDSPWKEMLEDAFPEFMAFYFPAAEAQIDWSRGHEFLTTELRQVVREAALGKRFADALVQLHLKDGAERWVYVHVEIQGGKPATTPRHVIRRNAIWFCCCIGKAGTGKRFSTFLPCWTG